MNILQKVFANILYQKEKLKTAADNLSRQSIPHAKEKYVKNTFQAMVGPAQTHPNHLQGTAHTTPFKTGVNKDTTEADLTGNNINTITQLNEASQASTAIHSDLTIVSKFMDQRKTALGA